MIFYVVGITSQAPLSKARRRLGLPAHLLFVDCPVNPGLTTKAQRGQPIMRPRDLMIPNRGRTMSD